MHVSHHKKHPLLVPARFNERPATPEPGIPITGTPVLQKIRGIPAEVQIPGLENMVTPDPSNLSTKR